jgi:membrane peptidoglycan carboxypeptidase
MANGGKLLVPQVPRGSDEARFKPKLRRKLDIDANVLQRMVPGMIGSVNFGSGRRAYDPTQTVAGKTGTCNGGEGSWVGLFTSYAPLANPRLAVVVITRGTDAHRHLPAAVAGQIYRDLSQRFGTPRNLQIASTPDDEEKDIADEEGEETIDTQNTASDVGKINSPRATVVLPNHKLVPDSSPNTVKRVIMPIQSRNNNQVQQPEAQKSTPAKSSLNAPIQSEVRPRRTQQLQP